MLDHLHGFEPVALGLEAITLGPTPTFDLSLHVVITICLNVGTGLEFLCY